MVHVSSFVVYDLPAEGELTEETIGTTARSGYHHVKRELETELLNAVRRDGVPATIVQPTIVYGPFSRPWTIDPADMLISGTVVLPDQGEGICNAVYVDDVVNAMILAAKSPKAVGRRFLVSGEPVTWAQFYEALAKQPVLDRRNISPPKRSFCKMAGFGSFCACSLRPGSWRAASPSEGLSSSFCNRR